MSDPEFPGFPPKSIFHNAAVQNSLPAGDFYYRFELVEGVKSLIGAALQGGHLRMHLADRCIAHSPLPFMCSTHTRLWSCLSESSLA